MNWQASLGIVSAERRPQAGRVIVERSCVEAASGILHPTQTALGGDAGLYTLHVASGHENGGT
jgi:hypothetical protein